MKRIAVNSKLLVTKFFDMTRIRIGLIGQLRSTFPHFTMCTISIHFNSFTIQIHRTKSFTMLQIIRSQALKALIIQTAIIKTCFCMSTSTRISKLIINIIFCSTHKIKNYFFTINQTTNWQIKRNQKWSKLDYFSSQNKREKNILFQNWIQESRRRRSQEIRETFQSIAPQSPIMKKSCNYELSSNSNHIALNLS